MQSPAPRSSVVALTDGVEFASDALLTEAQVEAARAAQCLPDLIAPEDIANPALFLASDDSRLITKQTISVNAGVL